MNYGELFDARFASFRKLRVDTIETLKGRLRKGADYFACNRMFPYEENVSFLKKIIYLLTMEDGRFQSESVPPSVESEDPFRVFRPLMIPLSGVAEMNIFTKGDQKIIIIGEHHEKNFCTELGFEPIARLIEDYLREADNVDFMIEMPNDTGEVFCIDMRDPTYVAEIDEFRKAAKDRRNASPFSVLKLTRRLVARFVEPQKRGCYKYERDKSISNRVHYMEPEVITDGSDPFISSFLLYTEQYVTDKPKPDNYRHTLEKLINPLIINELKKGTYKVTSLPWMFASGKMSFAKFGTSTVESQEILVKVCIDLLKTTRFFKKCFQREHLREVPMRVYVQAFMKNTVKVDMFEFYFRIQRFFVDIYTTCRILKRHTHESWYKNIVVYCGQGHAVILGDIFRGLEYDQHAITGIPFNPKCDPSGPNALEPRKGGHRKRSGKRTARRKRRGNKRSKRA
jgi:hypothetical protein